MPSVKRMHQAHPRHLQSIRYSSDEHSNGTSLGFTFDRLPKNAPHRFAGLGLILRGSVPVENRRGLAISSFDSGFPESPYEQDASNRCLQLTSRLRALVYFHTSKLSSLPEQTAPFSLSKTGGAKSFDLAPSESPLYDELPTENPSSPFWPRYTGPGDRRQFPIFAIARYRSFCLPVCVLSKRRAEFGSSDALCRAIAA